MRDRKPRHQFWTQIQGFMWELIMYRTHCQTGCSDTSFICVSLIFINDCSESCERHERVLSACIWNRCSIFANISLLLITTKGYNPSGIHCTTLPKTLLQCTQNWLTDSQHLTSRQTPKTTARNLKRLHKYICTHIFRYLQIIAAGKLKGLLSDVDCMTPHRGWLQVNSTSGRRS